MPKKNLREEILARRKSLAAETCLALSLEIQARFIDMIEYRDASVIALYSAILNEVFTEEILRAARLNGKKVVYPRVRDSLLEFAEVRERSDLVPGVYGILEPSGTSVCSVREIDLMLLPGVAFDLSGYRLGYGKGYYDRTLHGFLGDVLLVGLAFDMQVVETIPAEIHDVRLDLLLTEERMVRFEDSPPKGVKING